MNQAKIVQENIASVLNIVASLLSIAALLLSFRKEKEGGVKGSDGS